MSLVQNSVLSRDPLVIFKPILVYLGLLSILPVYCRIYVDLIGNAPIIDYLKSHRYKIKANSNIFKFHKMWNIIPSAPILIFPDSLVGIKPIDIEVFTV